MLNNDIKQWVEDISRPADALGGLSVCPYARSAEYTVHETDGSDISPPPWDFELMIYVLPSHYSEQEVFAIADEYNKIIPDMVFLPDPKDRRTEINGVQTNNGKHNLILCQWRDNLTKAREKLASTAYYSYWTDEYLKEIINA
jgi:hypothetical protein